MSAIYSLFYLIFLYLSHLSIISLFTRIIRKLGGDQRIAIIAWSLIFLPGTIIHEISHFLAAAITGARTGKIEIFPEHVESDKKQDTVALGYVQTQKLNPIQGFLVGIAPLVSGVGILVWVATLIQLSFDTQPLYVSLLEGYLFFVVANSFFPSKSDVKQTLPFLLIFIIIFAVALLLGFQLVLVKNSSIRETIDILNSALQISILGNLVMIIILYVVNRIKIKKTIL